MQMWQKKESFAIDEQIKNVTEKIEGYLKELGI